MKTIITLNPWKEHLLSDAQMLIEEGQYVYRINCKTATNANDYERLSQIINKVLSLDCRINVILDFGYPKNTIRAKVFNEDYYIKVSEGDNVRVSFATDTFDKETLYFECDGYQESLYNNARIVYADGENILIVKERVNRNTWFCEVSKSGLLWGGTSYHFNPEIIVKEYDYNLIGSLIQSVGISRIGGIALSFVEDSQEIAEFRRQFGHGIKIISKIESDQGLRRIEEVIRESDYMMLGRGDFAFNSNLSDFLYNEEKFIAACNSYGKPSIIATDILKSLTSNMFPSRGDLIDLCVIKRLNPDFIVISGQMVKDHKLFANLIYFLKSFGLWEQAH